MANEHNDPEFRTVAALVLQHAIIAGGAPRPMTFAATASDAVRHADALIEELNRTAKK